MSSVTDLKKLGIPAETEELFRRLEIYCVEDFLAAVSADYVAESLCVLAGWPREYLEGLVATAKLLV